MSDEVSVATPYFLERFGLRADADARAIRRAYAHELKRIDQVRAPGEFQFLRECYEAALAWAEPKTRAVDGAGTGMQAAPVPVPASSSGSDATGEDPRALAEAVFERLLHIHARLTEPGLLNDVATWQAEIRQRLADEELLKLSAKDLFEARIAQSLVDDFRDGHFALFLAAIEVFGWQYDVDRLEKFGPAGVAVNAAIDEYAMFHAQYEGELAMQRGCLDRMRRQAAPTLAELMGDVLQFEWIAARFPHFLAMHAPRWKIAQWQEGCEKLRAKHGDAAFDGRDSAAPMPGNGDTVWSTLLGVLCLILYVCLSLASCYGRGIVRF
jgi:hypothetical protein